MRRAALTSSTFSSAPVGEQAGRSTPKLAADGDAWAPSPASALQQTLAARLESEPRKWPPLATTTFVLVTCGGFWTVVGAAAMRLLAR